ncbi:MAG: alpha/beta hydrolase [Sphingobacteriales bacterium]|nr:MAG: alpha/beta hydrolase [Sphingobacteriales bacterium]
MLIASDRSDSGIFRVSFYEDLGGRPGKLLHQKRILRKMPVTQGWMQFDLKDEDIRIPGRFFYALEFIPTESKVPISYEIKPGAGSNSFFRSSSLGNWQRPPHRYRMTITVLEYGGQSSAREPEEPTPAFRIYSRAVADSFSIFIDLPSEKTQPIKPVPVIYLLDANLYFQQVRDSLRRMKNREAVIVGVGYKDFARMDSLRDRDYTYPAALPSDSFSTSGGGENFYSFLLHELLPLIDSMYGTDSTRRTLMGHSLGAYFTLFALNRDLSRTHPGFRNYVAASPSFDYHYPWLQNQLQTVQPASKYARIILSWGALESADLPASKLAEYEKMKKHLVDAVSGTKQQTRYLLYPRAGHMEAALPAFFDGLTIK